MKKIKIIISSSLMLLLLICTLFFGKVTVLAEITSNVGDEYYESVRGLKGEELKQGLYEIIKGHKLYSYSSLGDIMKITDVDPYNSNNMIFVYTGSTSKSTSYNKEHVWAKSRGDFGTSLGPGTDMHHLRPCYSNLNSTRSNYYFAEGGTEITNYPGNYRTSNSFEPSDDFKGDVARMIFYMATRYEGTEVVNGSTYNWPDLEIIDEIRGSDNAPYMGKLSDLYKWNLEDEVSVYEINRNNIIYSDYQKNRNPFIDHPEFIVMIYDETYDGAGALNDLTGSGSGEVEEKSHEEVIDEINKIGVVTSESNYQITRAETLYNGLSAEEKELVINYNELQAKRKIFDTLMLYNDVIDGDQVFAGNFLNRTGASSNSYKNDETITMNGQSFYVNVCLGNSSEFRLGANASNEEAGYLNLPTELVKDGKTKGALVEMEFNVSQANKVEILHSGTKYGTITGWSILYSLDDGATYEVMGSGTSLDEIVATSPTDLNNVRFAFILYGTAPRLCLLEFNIYKSNATSVNKEILIFNAMLDDIETVTANSEKDILALELFYQTMSLEYQTEVDYEKVEQFRSEYDALTAGTVSVAYLNSKLQTLNEKENNKVTTANIDDLYKAIEEAIKAKDDYLNKDGNPDAIVNLEAIDNAYIKIEEFFSSTLGDVNNYLENTNLITTTNYRTILSDMETLAEKIGTYETKFSKTIANQSKITDLENYINTNFQASLANIETAKRMIKELQEYVFNNGITSTTKEKIKAKIDEIDTYISTNSVPKESLEYSIVTNLLARLDEEPAKTGCDMSGSTVMIINLGLLGIVFVRRKEY